MTKAEALAVLRTANLGVLASVDGAAELVAALAIARESLAGEVASHAGLPDDDSIVCLELAPQPRVDAHGNQQPGVEVIEAPGGILFRAAAGVPLTDWAPKIRSPLVLRPDAPLFAYRQALKRVRVRLWIARAALADPS